MDRRTPEINSTDLREKLTAAVIAEAVEPGFAPLTVDRIVERAGVSRKSFDAQFADKEAAIAAAYQHVFERYMTRLLQTCEVQPSWQLKVKVGIGVTLDMAAASPVHARFLAEAMTGVAGFPDGMLDARDRLARLLAAGRADAPHGDQLPGVLESVLAGGIAWVIAAQLRAGEVDRLPALAPELVELALSPYLGREEAARVARRPRPKSGGQ